MDDIFSTLKNMLKPYEPDFHVKRDAADNYYLETVKADGTPEMFAAVQIKKSYVSFHLFPVYLEPSLLDEISDALRKRMQGKSCFNFGPKHNIPVDEMPSLVAQCAAFSKTR
ncbi:hypothetical protein [Sphingorhabdus sp.]|uniref:hypothetical protein n=1 Tax=Sphingorhabdus sp. TaxID=1902408 RepID=UPI0037C6BCAD